MMLAIRVEYLTGVCMATRHDDPSRSRPEWPPHPDRLFSALVAGAAELSAPAPELSEAAMCALRWLSDPERVGAVQLAVSEARGRSAPDVHMPGNPHEDEVWQKAKPGRPRAPQGDFNLRTLLPVHRKKAALPIPAVVPDDPAAYFIWPDAEPHEHLETLRGICRHVTYLGRSRSLVKVSIVGDPPPATHVPDELGQIQLRVPGPGRLGYLLEKYRRDGGKPAPSLPQRYRRHDQQVRPTPLVPNVFGRCWVFRPQPGDPLLPVTSTVKVTQAFRKALIACIEEEQRAQGTAPSVPDAVHGHGKHPHCAYVSLPFVHPRMRHADGSIKGLAIMVPAEVSSDVLVTLARGLMCLEKNGLGIPGIGTWHLQEVAADDPPSLTLDARTWTQAAKVWTTATPMVFGHYPKARDGGEAQVILESLKMVGVPPDRVLEIQVDRHSPLHGAPPSWCFQCDREREGAGRRPPWVRHVTVRLDLPVSGPLMLGRMRHFGLGLMRPVEGESWPS